jgi:tRNA G10  N-methylase Trm11
MQIFVLGRERYLCLAELIAKYGDAKLISDEIALVDTKTQADISKLGGSIKVANLIKQSIRGLKDIEHIIAEEIVKENPSSKFNFGLSYYGSGKLNLSAIGVRIKKSLQKQQIKPRLVLPNNGTELNAASIKHNKLTTKGAEFIIIQASNGLALARTTGYQDIDSYSKRDYEKPCRDRKVGMLPPKLSQIMINFSEPEPDDTIVDPFCGSGGLLMEASLMGYKSAGSDLSEEMIQCSKTNSEWFAENFKDSKPIQIEEAQDATIKKYNYDSYSVVTEGFLGQNFLSRPTKHLIKEQLPALKGLYLKFFNNLLEQSTQPNSICVCMPFWKFNDETVELNLIDEITNLGYTISKFKSVRQSDLYYYREGQFTGRQIIVFRIN